MMKIRILCIVLFLCLLLNVNVHAGPVDWSTITLSGSFPNLSFSDADLGTVTLAYSSNSEHFGITNQFAIPTLVIGNTGDESLTMTWSNPVTYFDMEIWDIDANPNTTGEEVNIVTTANISIVSLHSTDVWNSTTQTLRSDGTATANSLPGNYTIVGFSDSLGFDSITFNWSVVGTGILGIGKIDNISVTPSPVPEPATILIFGSGLIGLAGIRRRFRRREFYK